MSRRQNIATNKTVLSISEAVRASGPGDIIYVQPRYDCEFFSGPGAVNYLGGYSSWTQGRAHCPYCNSFVTPPASGRCPNCTGALE
jgi:hypothetical protein